MKDKVYPLHTNTSMTTTFFICYLKQSLYIITIGLDSKSFTMHNYGKPNMCSLHTAHILPYTIHNPKW